MADWRSKEDPSGWAVARPTELDAEEDPLVELARIVSEDAGFSDRRGERGEKVRPIREEPITAAPCPPSLKLSCCRSWNRLSPRARRRRRSRAPSRRRRPCSRSRSQSRRPTRACPRSRSPAGPKYSGRRCNRLSVRPTMTTGGRRAASFDRRPARTIREARAGDPYGARTPDRRTRSTLPSPRTRPSRRRRKRGGRSVRGAPSGRQQPAAGPSTPEYRFRGPAGDYKNAARR